MARLSERLEREAEAARAELAASLDELRARLTPGQVLDQLVGQARNRAPGQFIGNLGHQVRDNPIPATLMGAALVWLMLGTRRSHGDGQRPIADVPAASGDAAPGTGATDDSRRRSDGSGRNLLEIWREHPLVLGCLGMALGAALGAVLPPTGSGGESQDKESNQPAGSARSSETGASGSDDKAGDSNRRAEAVAASAGLEQSNRSG